ncbi:putative reverse transcriptase domain-containing protein [Tanacetum coccineum]
MQVSDNDLEALYVEANCYMLASHLFWALSALIQAKMSPIDFDYLEYFFQERSEPFNTRQIKWEPLLTDSRTSSNKLSRVHSTFHVSNLKKCLSDEPLEIPLDEIHIDDKLHFVEELVEIMNHEVKRLKQSHIPIIKVRWNSRRGPEFTWERKYQFRKSIPLLPHKDRTLGNPRLTLRTRLL